VLYQSRKLLRFSQSLWAEHQLGQKVLCLNVKKSQNLRCYCDFKQELWTFAGSASINGVSKRPGAIAITRMPDMLKSRAKGNVIEAMAPLVAA
jgi:hypothetical protein